MCIIIHRERSANVPNEVLAFNSRRNSDGYGLAWRASDGLKYEKFAPKEYDEFHRMLKAVDKAHDVEYAAHMRLATHGPSNRDLSHPFEYEHKRDGRVLVFHNGVIPIDVPDPNESDTTMFVYGVLAKLPSRWWDKPHYRYLVESSIGGSRLLIMTEEETVRINARSWTQQAGIWYSTSPGPTWGGTAGRHVSTKAPAKVTPFKKAYETSSTDKRFGDEDDFLPVWYRQVGFPAETHRIEALANFDDSDDCVVPVLCVNCQQTGEAYVIERNVYFDDDLHKTTSADDEDGDEETMALVDAQAAACMLN